MPVKARVFKRNGRWYAVTVDMFPIAIQYHCFRCAIEAALKSGLA